MAEPIPGDAPVPPDDTESGRAKHVAPTADEAVDHPAPARAATGPDAVRDTAADGAGRRDVAPAVDDRPAGDATETREERVVDDPARDTVASDPRARGVEETPTVRDEAPAVATAAAEPATARTPVTAEAARTDDADADRTAVLPAEQRGDVTPPPPPPPAPEQRTAPLPPADAPPPPRRGSNRLVGTAWVLLAALLFEVLYLAAYALLVVIVQGTSSVALGIQQLVSTPFAWLPLVLFVLFYELTVLLLNRAGRFAYVLSSLIVALIVYVLSAVLILAMQQGGISNEANLGRALIVPQVVLIPLVAREVMLWTGLAVGARGRRVRRRNRQAQEDYERERFASSVRGADDGSRAGA